MDYVPTRVRLRVGGIIIIIIIIIIIHTSCTMCKYTIIPSSPSPTPYTPVGYWNCQDEHIASNATVLVVRRCRLTSG